MQIAFLICKKYQRRDYILFESLTKRKLQLKKLADEFYFEIYVKNEAPKGVLWKNRGIIANGLHIPCSAGFHCSTLSDRWMKTKIRKLCQTAKTPALSGDVRLAVVLKN